MATTDHPAAMPDDQYEPPPRLFERLKQIAGYAWDDAKPAFHSSYDNW
jgi:hypothetical protein